VLLPDRHVNCSRLVEKKGPAMKFIIWVALAAVCLALFAGRKDICRFRRMRRM
jgi:hypothetical protein